MVFRALRYLYAYCLRFYAAMEPRRDCSCVSQSFSNRPLVACRNMAAVHRRKRYFGRVLFKQKISRYRPCVFVRGLHDRRQYHAFGFALFYNVVYLTKVLASEVQFLAFFDTMAFMQTKITLISDPKVIELPVKENGENLVDLQNITSLFVDLSRENVQKKSPNISFVRESVAKMLINAQEKLPEGYKLMIKEGHRDIETQREIFDEYKNFLKKEFPNLSAVELYNKASIYIAPPEIIPPHSTGGAIDLTLMTDKGEEIDMGTQFNADPEESDFSNYTEAPISEIFRERRLILQNAMESVGFVNYPTEWWHWSYGDRYWAFVKDKPFALYNSVNPHTKKR